MDLDGFPGCCGATTVVFDDDYELVFERDYLNTWFESRKEFLDAREVERSRLRDTINNPHNYLRAAPLHIGIVAEYQRSVLHPMLREAGWTMVRGATLVNPNTKHRLYLWYKDLTKTPVVEQKKRFV